MRNNGEVTVHGAWGAPPLPKKPPQREEAGESHQAEPRRNLGEILREFGENTTAHGVPRIASSKRTVTKLFWLVVFLTMLAIFCWQGTAVLIEYLGYPSTTKVKLVTNPELTFPSVTICNMNRFRRSKLADTRFDGLIRLDGGLTDDGGTNDYSWWFDWDPVWYDHYVASYQGSSSVTVQPSASSVTSGTPVQTDGGSATSGDGALDQLIATILSDTGTTQAESSVTPITSTSSNSGTSQTPTMASPGAGDEIATVGLSTIPGPTSISTGTTESGTTQQPPSYTTTSSHQPPTATETSRRKKRSLRQVRDAGTETASASPENNFMEAINEFGSWINQEWNDGGFYDTDFDFQYDQYDNWGGLEDENDWQAFYDRSTSPDYSDFIDIVNPKREELKELGHQAKDMIIQCTFDKKLCSYKDFYQFQNKEYGNCYTFNHGKNMTVVNVTKNSGSQYGLHVTLFIELPEYVGILSPEAGIRVAIHSNTTPPYPEDDGVTASPGMATNIGLRQVYVERLGRPHNTEECKPFTPASYARKNCYKKCVQEEMYKRCHCVSDILLENKTKCSYINTTQQKCKQLVQYLGEQKKLNCECPVACKETTYTKAVSSTQWPSERYEEHLQKRLKEDPDNGFAARMASSEERTSKNLVRVRVYFEELNYQSILEQPLYTFPNLLANVGGLLGLYIGVSFLTLAEVFALVFHIFKHLCRKTGVTKVSQTPVESYGAKVI